MPLGSSESHSSQPRQQTVSNSELTSSNSSSSNSSTNVDLLLDLGFDSSSQSQGQSSWRQGPSSQSQSSQGLDSNFDFLSGSTGNAKPAQGATDPWGEFTSARYICM